MIDLARLSMSTTAAPLRIMLVDAFAERLDVLASTLAAAGHRIVARLEQGADLLAEVLRVEPDVVIVDIDAPDRDILESMHAINRERPRPILVFTQDDNPELIRAAVKAGVSAYVVGNLDPRRVHPVLNVAIARVGRILNVDLPRPRSRRALLDHPDYYRLRESLLEFLTGCDHTS